jgi:threonine/homoserine/homoserine lactone efflux protein
MMTVMTHFEIPLFVQAMLVGLSIAAPVGPIGLLTIQRTLGGGMRAGLATGLGAAVADAAYGAVGAFGVVWVIALLTGARVPLALGGGVLLLWLAWQTWRSPLAESAAQAQGAGTWSQFVGTFALTLSNPATILSFIAIFGSMSASVARAASPLTMVAGVFAGSVLWWCVLVTLVAAKRHHFSLRWRQRINTASAAFLAAFAMWQVLSVRSAWA